MCIILGAMFEMNFEDAMDTAKNIADKNITLAVHESQIGDWMENFQIHELQLLNKTCSWKSIKDDKCVDECSCIKLIAESAYKGEEIWDDYGGVSTLNFASVRATQYEEIIKELMREGKYAIMKSYLTPNETYWGVQYNQGMGWHRSEDTVHGINPSKGYLTNKKWIFNEDITIFFYNYIPIYIFTCSFPLARLGMFSYGARGLNADKASD